MPAETQTGGSTVVSTQSLKGMSLIVTTVARPDALGRCLDAVLHGDAVPEEIVIVDQGDTAVCEREVLQRSGCGVRLLYRRQPRRGLSAGRNAGAAMACGNIIAITDDDCVPDQAWLLTVHQTLSGDSAPDAVTGRVLPLGPEMPGLFAVSTRSSTSRWQFDRTITPWMVGTGANFAIRRHWFEHLGGYDERLGAGSPGKAAEDMDLFYRLLLTGARIRYEPDAVVLHERQSLSRRKASRYTYGFGMGAFCGIRLRALEGRILLVLLQWLLLRLKLLARATVAGKFSRVLEECVLLYATARGTVAALLSHAER